MDMVRFKGGIMSNKVLCKAMLIMGIMISSISLFAQEIKSKQDVLDIINNIPMSQNIYPSFIEDYLKPKFSPSDVPAMYDYILDKTIDTSMRAKLARIAASLNPDLQQIERAINFAIQNMPEYNDRNKRQFNSGVILPTIKTLYKNTPQYNKLLDPFRKYYDDDMCGKGCKIAILQVLDSTQAPQNIGLYVKTIHDKDIDKTLKDLAVLALAKLDYMQSLPFLLEMTDSLFATDNYTGNVASYQAVVDLLGQLGKQHYEASKAVQGIINKVCTIDSGQYGYMLYAPGNVIDLFTALQKNPGEGNRKYLERFIGGECKNPNAKLYAINALGVIGNEGTISILKNYADLYPKEVENAIAAIQQRIQQ